jgi:hypothetical protein
MPKRLKRKDSERVAERRTRLYGRQCPILHAQCSDTTPRDLVRRLQSHEHFKAAVEELLQRIASGELPDVAAARSTGAEGPNETETAK